jgi:hypothetical protein
VHPCPSDCCRFDIIGLAAFSTDFKSLDGEKSAVATALTAVGHAKPSPTAAKILLLAQAFPILLKLPLPRSTLVADLSNAMDAVVDRLTDAAQSGKIGNENLGSVLGVLRERVYYEQQTYVRIDDTHELVNAKDLSPAQIRIHVRKVIRRVFCLLTLCKAKSILLAGFATTSSTFVSSIL